MEDKIKTLALQLCEKHGKTSQLELAQELNIDSHSIHEVMQDFIDDGLFNTYIGSLTHIKYYTKNV